MYKLFIKLMNQYIDKDSFITKDKRINLKLKKSLKKLIIKIIQSINQ